MKKGNLIIVIIVIVLGAVAAYFYFNNSNTTLKDEFRNFAVKDTANITKIFIADAKGNKVTLYKKEKGWLVDDKFKARKDAVNLILETFYKIDIKSPVPKSLEPNVIKYLATAATKVEIYLNNSDKPHKVYYIGNVTQDRMGTNMLLEIDGRKSDKPYVTHIPGFYGFLTTRFFAEPELWRDPSIFSNNDKNIQSIELTYPQYPEQSFSIEKTENGFVLYDNKHQPVETDTLNIIEYLNRYANVNFEKLDIETDHAIKDSVLLTEPVFIIKLTDINNQTKEVKGFNMPNFRKLTDHDGKPFPHDIDRLYGLIDGKDFAVIQYYTFDPLTIPLEAFKTNEATVNNQ